MGIRRINEAKMNKKIITLLTLLLALQLLLTQMIIAYRDTGAESITWLSLAVVIVCATINASFFFDGTHSKNKP